MAVENLTGDELRAALKKMGMKARQGALQLANVTTEAKNRWLSAMADPSAFTDVSDMKEAIEAIDTYLGSRRHRSRRSR